MKFLKRYPITCLIQSTAGISYLSLLVQKHRKNSGKKKKFFKEEDHFWKPDEDEFKIYDQLSQRQYREILRSQIK